MGLTAEKYASFPIKRVTKAAGDDDDLIVWGIATDATLDHDLQVCDPAWSGPAIKAWLASGRPAVRMAHDPRRPIGKGIAAETDARGATWVRSEISEPLACKLVRKSVLTAYSVGIANARTRPDPTGRAVNGILCAGQIVELTLCDVPSNPSCGITIAKSRPGEAAEYVGKAFGGKVRRPKTGKAFRRELAAWDLRNSDPSIRERAYVEAAKSRGLYF